MTGREWLRTLSDEELADFICGTDFCTFLCPDEPDFVKGCFKDCSHLMEKWLAAEHKYLK